MKTWEVTLKPIQAKESYGLLRFTEGPAGAAVTMFWQRRTRSGKLRNGYIKWPSIDQAPEHVQQIYFNRPVLNASA